MLEPALRDRLVAVYATWLDEDDLGQRHVGSCDAEGDGGATSVRQFIEDLLRCSSGPNADIRRPVALEHPDSTFMQLLGSPLVTRTGPRGLVASAARHALCLQAIPRLLAEAFAGRDLAEDGVPDGAPLPSDGARAGPPRAAPALDDPADRAALADELMSVLESRLGRRAIRSFFTVDAAPNGYRLWNPHRHAPKGSGVDLARHDMRTDAGAVSIDVMRYPNDGQTPVRAYEWCAELRAAVGSELPDAIAYGMAYCFERSGGVPVGGTWDLMTAADGLADVDLLQVNAFLEQHPDAEALIGAGDLAFVWLWERRRDARPGAGQACLRAALTDLRRRLRRIRTVVVDLKPYQYVVSDAAGTPTSLHIEKLEAVDRLQSFVDGLQLGGLVKGHRRYIVNRDGDDPKAAMRVLGRAGRAQQDGRWPGGG